MYKTQIGKKLYKFIIHSSQYEKQTLRHLLLGYQAIYKCRLPYHKIKGDEQFLSTDKNSRICSTLNDFPISNIWLQLFFLDAVYLAKVNAKSMKQIQINQREQSIIKNTPSTIYMKNSQVIFWFHPLRKKEKKCNKQ